MQYYVVTFTHTKLVGWAFFLAAHVSYLRKLLKEDKLQISGPGVGTPVRSAQLVFKVTDKKELDELVANDPYSKHGLVASKTENLWNVETGSMLKPAVPDPEGTKYFRAVWKLNGKEIPAEEKQKHDAYQKELLKEKMLRAAGAYAEKPDEGLAILSAKSQAAAEEMMKADPYVKDDGASYEVIQWDPKFGDFK